jgi:ABC-2 type transport system ATP-binding protein
MTSSDAMITARGLTKQFAVKRATVTAVTDLDLDVARGELVAFLGPNGAGKSTSLRMLTTLLPPTRGTAVVAGHDIVRDAAAVRRRIGYIGQGSSAGNNQRVRDELLSQGAFYGIPARAAARRADELLESLDLAPLARRPVMGLSGGQKRRLDIALGLIHSPSLLFLDEPSTGLDPQSRANLWRHIIELREQHGTTVFVTTHYLEEADQFAERVLVMDEGRVIADDSASSLKSTLAGDVISVGLADPSPAARARAMEVAGRVLGSGASDAAGAGAPAAGAGAAGASSTDAPPATTAPLDFVVDHGERLVPPLLREFDAAGLTVATLTLRQPTLDDVFLALTGRSLRDSATAPATADTSAAPSPTPADGIAA